MPVFVFRFGYESPAERASNERHGTDFESSQWALIEAADEAAALAWGCEVAERFVRQACGVSWRAGNFARWVEPLAECPWAVGRESVPVGAYPDLSRRGAGPPNQALQPTGGPWRLPVRYTLARPPGG